MNRRSKQNLFKLQIYCILSVSSVSSGIYAGNPASQAWVMTYVPPVVRQMIQQPGPTYLLGGKGPSGIGTIGYLTPNGQHGIEYISSNLISVQSQVSYLAWQIVKAAPGGPGNASNWTAVTFGQLNLMTTALGGCFGLMPYGSIWTADSPQSVDLNVSMVPHLSGNIYECVAIAETSQIEWIPDVNTTSSFPTIAVSTF